MGATWLFSRAEKGDGDGELARRRAYWAVGDSGEAGGSMAWGRARERTDGFGRW